MKVLVILSALLLLPGCRTAVLQSEILLACLGKCQTGDAACINACGNMLKSDCK